MASLTTKQGRGSLLTMCLLLFLACMNKSYAQHAPSGWSANSSGQNWTATSPGFGGGQTIRMTTYPAVRTQAALEAWAVEASRKAAAEFGEILSEHRTGRDDKIAYAPMIVKAWQIMEPGNSAETLAAAWVYDTPWGRQMIMTLSPALPDKADPAQNAMYTHIAAMRKERIANRAGTPSAALRGDSTDTVQAPAAPAIAVPSAPPAARPTTVAKPVPASSTPVATGKNCRREPVWGFRLSPFCQPSGVCPDRVIKYYDTVCD